MWLPDHLARWYDRFAPIHATSRVRSWRYVTPPLVTAWAKRLLHNPNSAVIEMDDWVETSGYGTLEERNYRALQAGSIACEKAGIVEVRESDVPEWRDVRQHWRRTGNLLQNELGLLLPRRPLPYRWATSHQATVYDPHAHFAGFRRLSVGESGLVVRPFVCVDPIGPVETLRDRLAIGFVPLIGSTADFDWQTIDPPDGSSRFRAVLRDPNAAAADAEVALRHAARQKCDILIYPELCLTPEGQGRLGAAIPAITATSGGYPWLVVAATAETTIGSDHLNRAVVFDGEGRRLFFYDKLHPYQIQPVELDRYGLPDALGAVPREEDIVTDSRSFCIADTPAGRIAVVICEDLSNLATYLPVTMALEVDWLLVPVLDGVQTDTRWTARRAREFAERGTSVVVVTSSSLVSAHLDDLARKGIPLPRRAIGLVARPGPEFILVEACLGQHNLTAVEVFEKSKE